MMIEKDISQIDAADLQRLIDNEVGESTTLEYKSLLTIATEGERKEFLSDVTSFVNAFGGDLIFGISEDKETNLPFALSGISLVETEDVLIRRIEDMLRDSVQPRITNIQFKLIPLGEGKAVLIMRIPASSFAPHRVIYKGHGHFYTRNSKGKYQMDVEELRAAFTHAQVLSDKIQDYVEEQFMRIISGKHGWFRDRPADCVNLQG